MNVWRIIFWILLIVNFAFRGFLVFQVDTQPISDFVRYYQAAISIAQGEGYQMFGRTTAFQGVGYPAFLAFFFYWFGPGLILAKSLNWILSLFSAFLFYRLVKRFASEHTALAATLVYIYLPKEILYVNVLGSEHLFNTLMLGFLFCYFQSWPKDNQRSGAQWGWLIVTGVLLGAMSLVKAMAPVFGLIVVAGEAGRFIWPHLCGHEKSKGVWGKAILRTALVAAVSMAVIAPWTYRNYLVFNAFVPVTTNGGYVLYVNNNPYATGAWMDPYKIPGSPIHQVPYPESDPRFEVAMNKMMKEAAQEWIRENPGRFSQLVLYRFYEAFYTNWDWKWAFESDTPLISEQTRAVIHRISVILHDIVASSYYIGYPVMLIGFARFKWRCWKRRNNYKAFQLQAWEQRLGIVLLGLPALMLTVVTMIFEGNARYSFPLHPAYALFTALIWGLMWRRMNQVSE